MNINQTQEQALLAHLSRMEKAQPVRVFDVLILAPALIYVGTSGKLSNTMGNFLTLVGVGTAIFNGHNYIKIEQLKKTLGN